MTAAELAGKLTAVNKRLALARDAERWQEVAAAEAERGTLTRQHDAALVAEREAEQAERLQREASHLANLTAQGAALQGRWLAWLSDIDACERTARHLWADYGAIMASEAALQREYTKATGGQVLTLTVGNLAGTALAVKRDYGALKWRPKLGPLDD